MKTNITEKSTVNRQNVPKFGIRHIITFLLLAYSLCMYLTRSTLSLAIVAMMDSTASKNPNVPTYQWTNSGTILSSFFWTYIVLQPFAGYIFFRFGLKWVVLVTMLINSVAFMIIPLAIIHFGANGLITCRLIQGLFQGFFYPAVFTALGVWVPANERSFLSMIIGTGNNIGYAISMLLTGYISASWWGWPAIFYIFGTISVIWCMFWGILAFNSPAEHPRISPAERQYIEVSLDTQEKFMEAQSVPLKAILTCLPFWAIVVANIGFSWGATIIDTELPTYLHKVLDFDITSNGVATALPQIVQLLISMPLGPLGDHLVTKKYISLWTWRRTSQAFGSFIPAIALIWLAYISKGQHTLSLVLLNIIIGTNVVLSFGSLINHVDLSPKYAGILLSIENTISVVVGMFAPIFIQYVVTDMGNIKLWRSVFISISALMVLTASFFIYFGSADIQSWNTRKHRNMDTDANTVF